MTHSQNSSTAAPSDEQIIGMLKDISVEVVPGEYVLTVEDVRALLAAHPVQPEPVASPQPIDQGEAASRAVFERWYGNKFGDDDTSFSRFNGTDIYHDKHIHHKWFVWSEALKNATPAAHSGAQATTSAHELLRDGAGEIAHEAFLHGINGGHLADLYKLPKRCKLRTALAPQSTAAIDVREAAKRFIDASDSCRNDGTAAEMTEYDRARHALSEALAAMPSTAEKGGA